jgi:hypothetical protein
MAGDAQDEPDDRRGDRDLGERSAEEAGLAGWLRRTLAPRPREVWVMEPDGRMRKGMKNEE